MPDAGRVVDSRHAEKVQEFPILPIRRHPSGRPRKLLLHAAAALVLQHGGTPALNCMEDGSNRSCCCSHSCTLAFPGTCSWSSESSPQHMTLSCAVRKEEHLVATVLSLTRNLYSASSVQQSSVVTDVIAEKPLLSSSFLTGMPQQLTRS